MNQNETKESLRALIDLLYPELGERTYVPFRGRVTAVHGDAGDVQPSSGPRRYSVDVQPILPDGTDDPSRTSIPDVPLPVQWIGPGQGIFCLPEAGSVVLVGFVDGNGSFPYVHSILPDGWDVPGVQPGQLLIKFADGHIVVDGTGITLTASSVLVNSADINLGGTGGRRLACIGDLVWANPNIIGEIAPLPQNGTDSVRAI